MWEKANAHTLLSRTYGSHKSILDGQILSKSIYMLNVILTDD
jgi:hypothetical protein